MRYLTDDLIKNMTLNHSALNVFFHMSNHYRKLQQVKSTIDNSLPEGYASGASIITTRQGRSRQVMREQSGKFGTPKKEDRGKCNKSNYYHWKPPKKHNCLNEIHNRTVRSVSLPPRPVTRRNPKDMPHSVKVPARALSSGPKKKFKNETMQNNQPLKPLQKQSKQNHLPDKDDRLSTTSTLTTATIRTLDYAHFSRKASIPLAKTVIQSDSSFYDTPTEGQHVTPLHRKNSIHVPDHEYLQFALRITEDIIRNDLYSNKEMRRVFNSHFEANRGRLDEEKMNMQIEHLCQELNIPLRESRDMNSLTREEIIRLRQAVHAPMTCKHGVSPKNAKFLKDENHCACDNSECLVKACFPHDTNTSQMANVANTETNGVHVFGENEINVVIIPKAPPVLTTLEPLTENTEPTTSHDTLHNYCINQNPKSESTVSEFEQPLVLPGFSALEMMGRPNAHYVSVGIQTSSTSIASSPKIATSNTTVASNKPSNQPIEVSFTEMFDNTTKIDPTSISETSSKVSAGLHQSTIKIIGQNNKEEEFILVPGPIYIPKSSIEAKEANDEDEISSKSSTYSQLHQNVTGTVHYTSASSSCSTKSCSVQEVTESKVNARLEQKMDQPPKVMQRQEKMRQMNHLEDELQDVDLTPQREEPVSFDSSAISQGTITNIQDFLKSPFGPDTVSFKSDPSDLMPNRDVPQARLLLKDDYSPSKEPYYGELPPRIAKFYPTIATQTSDFLLLLNDNYTIENEPPTKQMSSNQSLSMAKELSDESSLPDKVFLTELKDGATKVNSVSIDPDVTAIYSMNSEPMVIEIHDVHSEPINEKSTVESAADAKQFDVSKSDSVQWLKKEETDDNQAQEMDTKVSKLKKTDFLDELDKKPALNQTPSMEDHINQVKTNWENFRHFEDTSTALRQSSLKTLAETMELNFVEKIEEPKTSLSLSQNSLALMNRHMAEIAAMSKQALGEQQPSEEARVGCCGIKKSAKKSEAKADKREVKNKTKEAEKALKDKGMFSMEHLLGNMPESQPSVAPNLSEEPEQNKSLRFDQNDLKDLLPDKRSTDGSKSLNSRDSTVLKELNHFSTSLIKRRTSIYGVPDGISNSSANSPHKSAETSLRSSATPSQEDDVSVLRIKSLTNPSSLK